MLSRREFIGAGLGAAVATTAFALPGDKMRYAVSAFHFRGMPSHPEAGIKMTAAYGYHGIEPFQDDVRKYLSQPPEALKQVLDASGLALATLASGGEYFDAAKIEATIEDNAKWAKYISHLGCKHLKVNLSRRIGPEDLTLENAKILAKNLNAVGRRTADHGIKFAFHPHAWTIVERQKELDMMMEMTDPKLVYIVIDTAHANLGGIDPLKALRDYYPRVAAIHLKDTEPKYDPARGWRGPAPSQDLHRSENLFKLLGTGGVDFPAFFAELRKRNYDGWVTMDFDPPRPGAPNVEQQMTMHKKYLIETLKGQLRS